jgi:DNA-binding transcriptional LysR family regulator
MSIRRLRHFIVLAEEGNFARAAARIGMRQPPLSQSIARLEREYATLLFKRGASGTTLTPAGLALLPEARAAVAAADRGAAMVAAAARGHLPIRVGLVHAALWEALPRLLALAEGEEIQIQFEQMSTNAQLTALAEGSLDLGFVSPPFSAPARMATIFCGEEPVVAALPSAQFPPAASSVDLADIAGRLVHFPRRMGPVLHDAILAMFETAGIAPHVVHESPEMMTTLALVGAGAGVSFVPACLARCLQMRGVIYRPLANVRNVPVWPLCLAHMPQPASSPAARLLSAWRRALIAGENQPGMDFLDKQPYKPRNI